MCRTLQCFFFYPRKLKVPNKQFFVTFFGFFLGWKYFSRPLSQYLFGHSEVFSDRFSGFFSGKIFFFSFRKKNFKVFFYFWREKLLFFFLGFSFSLVKFCCFFSGTFCFSGSFQNFVSGSLKSSRAENLKFSREDFFYQVLNLKIMSPPPNKMINLSISWRNQSRNIRSSWNDEIHEIICPSDHPTGNYKNHAIDELAEHSNPIFNTPRNDTIHEIQFRSEIMKFMTLTKSLANT